MTTVRSQIIHKIYRNSSDISISKSIIVDSKINLNQLSIHTLSDCKCSEDIIVFLEKHNENINDSIIYVQALKKCHNFSQNDPRPFHKIFTMLLHSNHTQNILHFNTFFHVITDAPLLCSRYFKAMTTKYNIQPNIHTFDALINGCLKQKRYRTAAKYWYLMKEKYKINPTDSIYAKMINIYSKSHKINRAQKIFSEYLKNIQSNESNASFVVFNAYLNSFCSIGDIKGMKMAFKLMQEYKIKINAEIIGNIMNGYLIGCYPQKSLRTFNQFTAKNNEIEQYKKSEMKYLLNIKCKALHKMIENECDKNEQFKLYSDLKYIIFYQFDEYKLSVRSIRCLLESAICLFDKKNPIKIVQIFESLVNENRIKYLKYYQDLDIFAIDLHDFGPVSAKFVLSYCIQYKLKELIKDKDTLIIIVGKGLHTQGKKNKHCMMREFVINELLTYTPPINCKQDTNNKGRLFIQKNELLPYLK